MAVRVEGLNEMTRAFAAAGVDVEELKDVMGGIAAEAASTMQRFVPSRTGRLRASVRGNRAKGKAVVTAGRARVPYAGAINYGWPKRGIKAANFTGKTDAALDDKIPDLLEQGWADIAERHGLT